MARVWESYDKLPKLWEAVLSILNTLLFLQRVYIERCWQKLYAFMTRILWEAFYGRRGLSAPWLLGEAGRCPAGLWGLACVSRDLYEFVCNSGWSWRPSIEWLPYWDLDLKTTPLFFYNCKRIIPYINWKRKIIDGNYVIQVSPQVQLHVLYCIHLPVDTLWHGDPDRTFSCLQSINYR